MVRPHDEAQATDRNDCPNHHSVAKDILARVYAQDIRNQAESRKCNYINLWMAKEPEQVLEQDRAAAFVVKGSA